MKKEFTKREFKKKLMNKTGCGIQYNGWTCGTCFFAISKDLINLDWRCLLYYRGDYPKEDIIKDLGEFPKDYQERINKIWGLIK